MSRVILSGSPFLLLCVTGLFAIFSSTISKSPVLPLFASHMGADPAGVGFIAAVSAFTGVVFSIPAGILSDRIGKRKMLLFSSVIFATAPFLYLGVTRIWHLALVRFYHGFATAIFIPVAMALISEFYQKERGEKMGWFSTATLAGRFMAPVAGGSVIGAMASDPARGYMTVYLICGITGVAALLLVLRVPRTGETRGPAGSWDDTFTIFRTVFVNRKILITSAVEAAVLFAYGTFETFLPLYSVSIGLSAYEIGIFLSAQVISLAVSKPAMGRFSDIHGRRPQIFAGAFIGAACIGSFGIFRSFIPLLCLSIGFGLCLSIVTSATSAYIADLSSRESRGSAMGLLGSIMDIGHTTGPLASGIVAAYFGYSRAFATASFILVLLSLVFLGGVGIGRSRPGTNE